MYDQALFSSFSMHIVRNVFKSKLLGRVFDPEKNAKFKERLKAYKHRVLTLYNGSYMLDDFPLGWLKPSVRLSVEFPRVPWRDLHRKTRKRCKDAGATSNSLLIGNKFLRRL